MLHLENVGTAPGTTVLRIPAAAMKQKSAGLGTVYPTDFDKAKMYDYLPVENGWVPGVLSGAMGDLTPAQVETSITDLQTRLAQLEVLEKQENIRSTRSQRIWGAVLGVTAVGGLVVSVISLARGRGRK